MSNLQTEMEALLKKHNVAVAPLAAPAAVTNIVAPTAGVAPVIPPVGSPTMGQPGFQGPPAMTVPESIGWSVPVEIPVQDSRGWGKATVHLAFPAATWPQAQYIIQGLLAANFEVRLFRPKPPGGYNNSFPGGRPPMNGGGGYGQRY